MANKQKLDYRELSSDELQTRLAETREKLFQMRFQNATAPLKNAKSISTAKREVARLLTVLHQKGQTVS